MRSDRHQLGAKGAPPLGGLAVLRQLVAISAPPWGRLAVAMGLGVAAAAATIGLLAGSGYVVDRAALHPGLGAIAGVLAVIEVLAFLRAPLRYGERLVSHDAAFRALSHWRVWLYDCLEPLSPAGLRAWRSGDLLSRGVEDVDALQDLYLRGLAPAVVALGASVLAVLVVGLLVPLAALVLAMSLFVALVGPPLVAIAARKAQRREAELRGLLSADIVDLLQGAPDLLAFGHDHELLGRIERTQDQLGALARRRSRRAGLSSALITLCVGGAVVGVLVTGLMAVRHGRLNPVMLAVLPLAALGGFEVVPAVSLAVGRIGDVVDAGRRLLAIGSLPVPVTDPEHCETLPPGCPAVELRDARLRYRPDLPWALDGLTLTLAPGRRVAVVGSSGAGKSSLVNVLLRFWPLHAGQAHLGGRPLEVLAQGDVRRTIALVGQDATLFSGSIRQNLALARPAASDEDLAEVLSLSHLSSWVAALPDGLDTAVGELGTRVSGGQRQRIALARALLAGAPILVLDEPTAGLDEATASQLLSDVASAALGHSLLVVTHRQCDLGPFDEVAEIDRGKVVSVRR